MKLNRVVKNLALSLAALVVITLFVEAGGQIVFRGILKRHFHQKVEYILTYREMYCKNGPCRVDADSHMLIDGVPMGVKGKAGNKYGLFEREFVRKDGRRTVFLAGDSMMEQTTLSEGTSEILQRMFKERDLDVDFINFARGGFNILQESALIRGVLIDRGPDEIWWVMFLHNDFEDTEPHHVGGLQCQEDLESYRGLVKFLESFFITSYVYRRGRGVLIDLFPEAKVILPKFGVRSDMSNFDNYVSMQKKMFYKNYVSYVADVARTVELARERGVVVRLYILQHMRDPMREHWLKETDLMVNEFREVYGINAIPLREDFLEYDQTRLYDETGHFVLYGAKAAATILAEEVSGLDF